MSRSAVALVGPATSIRRTYRILSSGGAIASSMLIVGAVSTDGTQLNDLPLDLFDTCEELLKERTPTMLFLLDPDPDVKMRIRRTLPPDIELLEKKPVQVLCASILNQQAFVRKSLTRQLFLDCLIESLPAAAIIFDKMGHVLYWNAACSEMTDIVKEDVLGNRDIGSAFYHDADRPLLGQLVLETLDPASIRRFYPGPDLDINPISHGFQLLGNLFTRLDLPGYFQIIAQRIMSDGEIIGSIELIQDLSSIHILQQQLQKKQEQLQTIISHLPFPLVHTNLEGGILFANKAAQQNLLHERKKRTNSRNLMSLFPELKREFKTSFLNEISRTPPDEMPNQSKIMDVHISDQEWGVTCLALPEQGVTWTLIWIMHNISYKEEQDRLNAAVAMAGAISHELSQPLTAIINSSQLLSNTSPDDPERFKRHLSIIAREGERVLTLYRKLRNISKVKLTNYLDMQILDLDKSADLNLTITPAKKEK